MRSRESRGTRQTSRPWLARAAACSATAVVLAACGSTATPKSSGTPSQTLPSETHLHGKLSVFDFGAFTSGVGAKKAYKQIVTTYESAHPGVKVAITPPPPSNNWQLWEDTVLAAGTAPAVVAPTTANTPWMHTSWYTNLTALMNHPDPYVPGNKSMKELLSPAAVAASTFHGNFYSVDLTAQDAAIYYNKSLFARAGIHASPTTWAQLFSDARRLKAAGITPFGYSGGDTAFAQPSTSLIYALESNTMQPVFNKITGHPGALVSPGELVKAIESGAYSTKSPGFSEAWLLLKQLSAYFQPGYLGSCITGFATCARAAFASGKVAMDYSGQYNMGIAAKGHINYGLFAVPQLTSVTWAKVGSQSQGTGVWGSWNADSWAISANAASHHQLALADNFMQWVMTPKHVHQFAADFGFIPMTPHESVSGSAQQVGHLNFFKNVINHQSPISEAATLVLGPAGEASQQKILQEYLDGQASLASAMSQEEATLQSAASSAAGWALK